MEHRLQWERGVHDPPLRPLDGYPTITSILRIADVICRRSFVRLALLLVCAGGGCRRSCLPTPPTVPDERVEDDAARQRTASDPLGAPPPREDGPPLPETAKEIEAAAREAAQLAAALVKGGVPPREVASVADMRGYRLYRRRAFRQARAWFDTAIGVDARFELSLYNAARCAALLGKNVEARGLLARLRALDTPLARSRLRLAERDPDLATLRRGP